MNRIDVIIPVYNNEDTIESCLDSVLAQTFTGIRIFVVNDGSTDSSVEKIKAWEAAHPNLRGRFTLITQENKGAPTARNAGVRAGEADYVICLDADIVMQPYMLERMHTTLSSNDDVSYVYSSFKLGRKLFKLWPFDPERLKKMPYIHTSSLIKRKDFPGFDPQLKRFQDWDLWLTMLQQGKVGLFIPEVLFTITAKGKMSSWLPSFAYKLFPKLKRVDEYEQARKVIVKKHKLKI